MEHDSRGLQQNTGQASATHTAEPRSDKKRFPSFTEYLKSLGLTESKMQEQRQRAISVKLRSL